MEERERQTTITPFLFFFFCGFVEISLKVSCLDKRSWRSEKERAVRLEAKEVATLIQKELGESLMSFGRNHGPDRLHLLLDFDHDQCQTHDRGDGDGGDAWCCGAVGGENEGEDVEGGDLPVDFGSSLVMSRQWEEEEKRASAATLILFHLGTERMEELESDWHFLQDAASTGSREGFVRVIGMNLRTKNLLPMNPLTH